MCKSKTTASQKHHLIGEWAKPVLVAIYRGPKPKACTLSFGGTLHNGIKYTCKLNIIVSATLLPYVVEDKLSCMS